MTPVDTTIRNLDEKVYRELKAYAALSGKTIGEVLNEAIHAYLGRSVPLPKTGSLSNLAPKRYAKGTERLSEEIDRVAYGV